jgi:phosphoribosylaminoimidazole carboxylase PurE protein
MTKTGAQVGVIMGSDSDLPVMQGCIDLLKELGIACEVRILSAHRTPVEVDAYAAGAAGRGLGVIIAAAGMSAALGGVLSARTSLPVIGVAMASGPLAGVDALLSTVQMPPGVPVACTGMAAAGATNAALLAARILALSDPALAKKLEEYRLRQGEKVLAKDRSLQGKAR